MNNIDLRHLLRFDFAARQGVPSPGVTGRSVADGVPPPTRALFAPTLADATDAVMAEARPGDLVLTMGAGDITSLGQELVARLERLWGDGNRDTLDDPA